MSIPQEVQKIFDTPTLASLGPERRPGALNLDQCLALFDTLDLAHHQQPLIHSALLLWHDHLDASHDLSQNINSNDGSFLHGIMHRREPDYSNAKYWLTRAGQHEAFDSINTRAAPALKDTSLTHLATEKWDAFASVDAVSEASPSTTEYQVLQELQRIELEVLLERFCR